MPSGVSLYLTQVFAFGSLENNPCRQGVQHWPERGVQGLAGDFPAVPGGGGQALLARRPEPPL